MQLSVYMHQQDIIANTIIIITVEYTFLDAHNRQGRLYTQFEEDGGMVDKFMLSTNAAVSVHASVAYVATNIE